MTQKKDSVDILLASYNGALYIKDQIRSIQDQSFKNWRLLISDDCSNDGTLEIIQKEANNDSRISILSKNVRKGSAKDNFMSMLSAVNAPYAMFCDQDDVWLPNKIEFELQRMHALEKESNVHDPLLVYCDMKVVDEKLNIISESFEEASNFNPFNNSLDRLIPLNTAAGCTQLMNKRCAELCSVASDYKDIEMHDWWAMLVAASFGKVAYLNQQLSLYRQHETNEVGANTYSPIKRALNFSFMESEFVKTIRQTAYFNSVYKDLLQETQYKEKIESYANILNAGNYIHALKLLNKSGCWKPGIRKLGQVAVIAHIKMGDNTK